LDNEELGLILKRIFHEMKKNADRNMKDFELTMSQFMILDYIGSFPPGQASQRDIEHHFKLKHPTVSGILKRLERNGFVTFAVNEDDRRIKDVALTGKIKTVKERICVSKDQIDEKMVTGLSEEEVEVLKALLNRVLNNITDMEV